MLSMALRKILSIFRSEHSSEVNLSSATPSCTRDIQDMFSPVYESSKDLIAMPVPTMHPCSHEFKNISERKIRDILFPLRDPLPLVVLFEQWIAQTGRVYKDAAEKAHRFAIFKESAKRVDSSNAVHGRTYTICLNHFSDQTYAELKSKYLLCNRPRSARVRKTTTARGRKKTTASFNYYITTNEPESMNLKSQGVVTPEKEQGFCKETY